MCAGLRWKGQETEWELANPFIGDWFVGQIFKPNKSLQPGGRLAWLFYFFHGDVGGDSLA